MQTCNYNSRPHNSSIVQFCYNTRTCKRTKCSLTYYTYRGEYALVSPEWYLQYQPDWQNSTEKQRKTLHVHQRKKISLAFPSSKTLRLVQGQGKNCHDLWLLQAFHSIFLFLNPTLWNLSKNALKRKIREKKILFDVRASEDRYNDLQEIIQTLNSWLS